MQGGGAAGAGGGGRSLYGSRECGLERTDPGTMRQPLGAQRGDHRRDIRFIYEVTAVWERGLFGPGGLDTLAGLGHAVRPRSGST